MNMNRDLVNMPGYKLKHTRSLLWYVDCLVVVGVLGVVAGLVLVNFVLV